MDLVIPRNMLSLCSRICSKHIHPAIFSKKLEQMRQNNFKQNLTGTTKSLLFENHHISKRQKT